MAREVSTTFRGATYAHSTEEVELNLLEIIPAPGVTLRYCDNTEAVMHNGNSYEPFPFTIEYPGEAEGLVRTATLEIDHVDRAVYTELVSYSNPRLYTPTVRAAKVLASDPETVEIGWLDFKLGPFRGDEATLRATLTLDLAIDTPFPGHDQTPAYLPKLFTALSTQTT